MTPSSRDSSGKARQAFPIVGMGASAGGLEASRAFFGCMPADGGLAYVLVQHLDPTHESLMVELLSQCTPMPVAEAEDEMTVEIDHVYLIPRGRHLEIENGRLRLREKSERTGAPRVIDTFFRSLAEDLGEAAIGIVLSGSGTDGTEGLREIARRGGMVLVQDPSTAVHDGMPRSAIASRVADAVVPVEEMPEVLLRYARHAALDRTLEYSDPVLGETSEKDLNTVLSFLRTDFRHYKRSTLVRRIERRMGLHRIDSLSGYLTILREKSDEANLLEQDFLIGVTSFFRDPDSLDELEKLVVQPVVERANGPIRVWVPACATGEEAYSIAILFFDQFLKHDKRPDLQIFASDIDADALEVARTGVFQADAVADIAPERLERHFRRIDDDRYQIRKDLREAIVFAEQNVIGDPPFSKLDLISCRNLLIYMQTPLQEKVVSLFHFALKPGGHLLLGSAETIGSSTDLFEPISKRKTRVYRRLNVPLRTPLELPIAREPGTKARKPPAQHGQRLSPTGFAGIAQRWILDEFAPATAIVNRKLDVLYLYGDVDRYLNVPTGEPRHSLPDMLREGLKTRVRGAIHRAVRDREVVQIERVRVRRDGRYVSVRVLVTPERREEPGLWMVSFMESESSSASTESGVDVLASSDRILDQLESELGSVRDDLQGTIEELEASNEELKVSNEEVVSINEELQSTNEELETSTEELQSTNEELETVNSELQAKVLELQAAKDDIINLFHSTSIATLFLDADFRIRRFTPAMTELVSLIPSDIGRPMSDIARSFSDADFDKDARAALTRSSSVAREIKTHDDRWFIRRASPYRDERGRVGGVVVTFTEVTSLRQAEQSARERLSQLEAIYANAPVGLAFLDSDCRYVRINEHLAQINGIPVDDTLGKTPRELFPGGFGEQIEAHVRELLETGESLTTEAQGRIREDYEEDWVVNYFPTVNADGNCVGVNAVVQDITERKLVERILSATRESGIHLAIASDYSTVFSEVFDVFATEFGAVVGELWRPTGAGGALTCEFVRGVDQHGQDIAQSLQSAFLDEFGTRLVDRAWEAQSVIWFTGQAPDGTSARPPGTGIAIPVDAAGELTSLMCFFLRGRLAATQRVLSAFKDFGTEIGHLRRIADQLDLQKSHQMLQDSDRRKDEFLAVLGHELRNPLSTISNVIALLEQGTDDEEWAVKTIRHETNVMIRLIADLLDLTRVRRGKLDLRRDWIVLTELIERTTSAFEEHAEKKEVVLDTEWTKEPVRVYADSTRLEQVLFNLLSNALKFTGAGGRVRVSAELKDGHAVIRIADTGIGIEHEDIERIFDPFEQLDHRRRSKEGLGIGLPLVRELVELHGGSVSAHSEGPGKGATFEVRLPIKESAEKAPRREKPDVQLSVPAGLEVLVIDDNQESAETLALILQSWGCQTRTAFDGASGLKAALDDPPGAIILDVGLPDISGHEIAETLRAEGLLDVLLVALSGYGSRQSREASPKVGFDHHLTKPANLNTLRRLLASAPKGAVAE